MIGAHQIDLGEDGCASLVGGKILDVWNRVAIRCGNIIQVAVVSTGAPFTVALGNHVKRRSPCARGRTYDAHVKKFVKLSFGGDDFLGREAAWSCKDRAPLGDNVMSDTMFNWGIAGARGF